MKMNVELLVIVCLFPLVSPFSNKHVVEVMQNLDEKANVDLNGQMVAFQRASLAYMAYASYFDRSNVNLPGFRKFFLAASKAALNDAQKVIDYINLRGGHHQFTNIKMRAACKQMTVPDDLKSQYPNHTSEICNFILKPRPVNPLKVKQKNKQSSVDFYTPKQKALQSSEADWKKGLMAITDSLFMERSLNSNLLKLVQGAVMWQDAHLRHVVEDSFLMQQTKRIQSLTELIAKLRQYSELDYPLAEYTMDLEMSG